MTTWGDLRAGDVIEARAGGRWQLTGWADRTGDAWIGAGGGGADRVFTLAPVDAIRPPITAPHVLSDPVSRVFQYSSSTDEQTAAMALAAVFQLTLIEESIMDQPITPVAACTHPSEAVSTLRGGKVICTECFTTLHDPAAPAPVPVEAAIVAAPPGALDNIVPPYAAVDPSGVEYSIPARDRRDACAANIHPVLSVRWLDHAMVGCDACGLAFPLRPTNLAKVVTADDIAPNVALSLADSIDQAYRAAAFGHDEADVEALDNGAHLSPEGMVVMGTDEHAVAAERVPAVVQVHEPVHVLPIVDAFSDPAGSYEVKRDRWKRYLLPDPYTGEERAWTRASTLARCLADEYQLTGWKLRMVAIGIAKSKDLAAGVLAIKDPDEPEAKKTLKDIVGKAMERAESSRGATFGTALHNFTHRLDRGEPMASLNAPEPLDADLVEYQATLARYGLGIVPDLIERIVVCPDLGAAGTLDRILSQHPGPFSQCPLTVGDLKTGKTVDWSWLEWAIQLAIYANATHMWDPVTASYIPMPAPDVLDRDRALIIHLPVGKATGTVYGVNLIEGYEAAKLAERVRVMRNNGKGYGWSINPVNREALLIYRVSHADASELARLWDKHHPAGEWTDAVAHAAEERVARLRDVPVEYSTANG